VKKWNPKQTKFSTVFGKTRLNEICVEPFFSATHFQTLKCIQKHSQCILKHLQRSPKEIQNVPYHWKIILRNSENGHVLLQLTRISRALFQKINYGENFLIFLISIQWMPTSMLGNLRPSLPVSVHTQNMTAASWHTENHVRIIEASNAGFFNIFWGLALRVLNGIQADITMLKHRMDNKDPENQDPSCANAKCDWMTLT